MSPPGPTERGTAGALEAELRGLLDRSAEAALFFDFDGTLARIVDEPEAAHAVDGVADLLARLVDRFLAVTVVSGRSVSALRERIAVPGVRLVGLYGMEEEVGDEVRVFPAAAEARTAVRLAAADLAERFAADAGVFVEPKGLAVSVHFRRCPDPEQAMHAAEPVVHEVSEQYGLGAVMPGKLVLELKPAVPVDKGVAVRRTVEQTGARAVMVAGDDIGDIPAFHAAAEVGDAIRIVVGDESSPIALLGAAEYRVGSPEELIDLLGRVFC